MSEARSATKLVVLLELAILLVAAAILIPAVTPGEAVTGGPWVKLVFLGRIAALVALASWMLHRRSLAWSDVGLNRPAWRRFLVALLAGLVVAVLSAVVAGAVLAHAGLKSADYSMFAPIRGNLGQYLFWLLAVTIGTAAFGEELIFRGFITDALCSLLDGSGVVAPVIAIAVQAIIFGALHFYQGLGGMIMAGSIGFALGLTWLIAGRNLWAGIIIHALLDGSAMTAIYLGYVTT